ncbi:MAG: SDR family oxidoreductase [Rhodospirillales bacterium]|jgi:3-oxoacyl-[acyl-carrier protein] reductase|nr:SDR family oxidoreductase [Rhodospirillales bacterium]MDP7241858.1 SDR family oxidoreductase [Rhodospirillales bacterium]HJO71414.1 SDR family oxidoreductase [Rhodospirillales bacterium]
MDMGIAGKTALLLASTKGLGFGCAKALVGEGVKVAISGRTPETGAAAAENLGANAHFIAADIAQPEDRARLYAEAKAHLGAISILVTNAGGPQTGAFMDVTADDWSQAFELVIASAVDIVRRCVPDMVEAGFGRIVNISSMSAKETTRGTALANSLKPGLVGAFATLGRELAETGVTANSIMPGPFDTELLLRVANKLVGREDTTAEEAAEIYAQEGPMKRLGRTEEFGALCAFLCSRHAGYITAQSYVIDGGHVKSLF